MTLPATSDGVTSWTVAIVVVCAVGVAVILYLYRKVERLHEQVRRFRREKTAVYALLNKIGSRIRPHADLDAALEAILSFLVETTRSQAGAVFLVDGDRQWVKSRVIVGMFPPPHAMFDQPPTRGRHFHRSDRDERFPTGKGIIGEVAATGEAILVTAARSDPRVHQVPGFEINTMMAVPLIVGNLTEGVFALVNRIGGEPFTEEDLGILRATAEQASVTIHIMQMYDALAEKRQIEQELLIAQEFQKLLLPKEFPRLPGAEIAASSLPALEVGGDFYDFFWLDGERLGIVIADVAGKGIRGALVMTMMRSVMRAESSHADSPCAVLERVNQRILADTRERLFITMIFAILDLSRRTLTFARAGHEPLVAFSRTNAEARLLAPEGIALGLVDSGLFSLIRDMEVPLNDGDIAVLYTDGMIEAMDERGCEYGQERLLDMLRTHADASAEDLVHTLLTDVRHFTRGQRQSDDVTLVVLKFNQLACCAEALADSALSGLHESGPGEPP